LESIDEEHSIEYVKPDTPFRLSESVQHMLQTAIAQWTKKNEPPSKAMFLVVADGTDYKAVARQHDIKVIELQHLCGLNSSKKH